MNRKLGVLAATAALALAPGAAYAGTASGTMGVTAAVVATASVVTTPVAFGVYDPTTGSALPGTGAVTVLSTAGLSYSLTANNGANASGSQRRLTDGASHYLNYDLFTDSARTNAWSGTTAIAGTGSPSGVLNTIYAQIPASQNPPVGAYTDTVTVTATF